MPPTEPIADALHEMARTFEGCVVWAVRAILETEILVTSPFRVVASVPEGPSLFCILPTGSPQYHSLLTIGVNDSDLSELFPAETDARIRKDALGEMANVISGLFVADDIFIGKFGYLKPSTPFFSEGVFTAQKDWGIEGKVEAHGKEIMLHFSIRLLGEPAQGGEAKTDDDEEAIWTPGSPE